MPSFICTLNIFQTCEGKSFFNKCFYWSFSFESFIWVEPTALEKKQSNKTITFLSCLKVFTFDPPPLTVKECLMVGGVPGIHQPPGCSLAASCSSHHLQNTFFLDSWILCLIQLYPGDFFLIFIIFIYFF